MRRTFQDLARAAKVNDLATRAVSGNATEAMQMHHSTVSPAEVKEGLAKVISLAGFRRDLEAATEGAPGASGGASTDGTRKAGSGSTPGPAFLRRVTSSGTRGSNPCDPLVSAEKRDGTSDASDEQERPTTRDDVPLRQVTGESDRPIDRLTRAIVLASEAGQWDVVRVLVEQVSKLEAEPAAPRIAPVLTLASKK